MGSNESNKITVLDQKNESIHGILAQSYSIFFFSLILGMLADIILPLRIIPKYIVVPVGFLLLVLAPFLIFGAQHSSRQFRYKKKDLKLNDFKIGPYSFTRSPTHAGVTMLLIGFGFVANSIYIIIFSIIACIISRRVFLKKEEQNLEKKYGEEYQNYKMQVSKWF